MPDGVIITGLVETQQMIRKVPRDLVAEDLQSALMAGGAVVQEELVRNAPRRKTDVKGSREFPPLSESAVTDVEVNASKLSGVASTGFGDAGPVANWEEYGHEVVTRSGRDTGKRTEPNPFMRRSTDNCAETAIDAALKVVAEGIKRRYGRT